MPGDTLYLVCVSVCKYRVRGNVSCLVFWDRVELSDAGDASVVLTH